MQFKTKEIKTDTEELIRRHTLFSYEERLYWLDILPSMSTEMKNTLRKIIIDYKDRIVIIDREFEQKAKALNEKHLKEWEDFYK